MFKIILLLLALSSSLCSNADTVALQGDASQQIKDVFSTLQAQIKQTNDQLQTQLTTLNIQIQNQIKQQNEQTQRQLQELNTKLQDQLKTQNIQIQQQLQQLQQQFLKK